MEKRTKSLIALLIFQVINISPLFKEHYTLISHLSSTAYFNQSSTLSLINKEVPLVLKLAPSSQTSMPLTIECKVNNNVSVIGGMDGLASIEILDGTAPYSVRLVDIEFTSILSLNGKVNFPDLGIGDYTVEAIDTNGEIGFCTFTIRNPCIFMVNSTSTEITCFEAKDGTISLDFLDGIAPYSIKWSNSDYDGLEEIKGLDTGNYQVIVIDAIGCIDTTEVTITKPLPLNAQITQDSITLCTGSSTPINLVDSYEEYSWSNMDTTSSIIVNEEGVYKVTVTDVNGCTDTASVQVELIDQDTIREHFFTCDPSRTGDFFLERRNEEGCMDIVSRTLSLAMVDTFFREETTCDFDEAGVFTTIIANNTGCSALFIRKINFLQSDTTYIVETSCFPKDTGMVQLAFVNQSGCDSIVEITTTLEVFDDCLINFIVLADTLCRNEAEGMIQLEVTFGDPPFSYFLIENTTNDTIEQGIIEALNNTVFIDKVQDGDYTINITNQNTISGKEETVFFTKYPSIAIQSQLSDYAGFSVSCEGEEDGSIQLSVSGGQAPYRYLWESGETTPFLQNLTEGIYTVTVSDAFNCEIVDAFNLFPPSPLLIDYQEKNPICSEGNLGQFVINDLLNTNGPAEYSLDGIIFQSIDTLPFVIPDLNIGNYQLFIQDENDCQLATFFEIVAPLEKQLSLEGENILELGDSLILLPSANFEIVQFEWSATIPLDCTDCSALRTMPVQDGQYTLTAYDAVGCSVSISTTVKLKKEQQVFIPNVFSPNGDGINDVYQIFTGQSIRRINQFQVFAAKGRLIYQVNDILPNDTSIGWDGRFNGQKMLPAVFVVFVEVELIDGTIQQYRETITLVK